MDPVSLFLLIPLLRRLAGYARERIVCHHPTKNGAIADPDDDGCLLVGGVETPASTARPADRRFWTGPGSGKRPTTPMLRNYPGSGARLTAPLPAPLP